MLRARISAIDHRHEYGQGGPTNAANAQVLCDHHNRFKTRHDYRARRMPNGWWILHRPDGTPLQPPDAA